MQMLIMRQMNNNQCVTSVSVLLCFPWCEAHHWLSWNQLTHGASCQARPLRLNVMPIFPEECSEGKCSESQDKWWG